MSTTPDFSRKWLTHQSIKGCLPMTNIIYRQGDLVWINFNPTQGHEQKGRRPAIIYSVPDFQRLTGLIAVMPITTKFHRYNINIELPAAMQTRGYIICQQFRTIDADAKEREVSFIEHSPRAVVNEIIDILNQFIKE